MDTPHFDGTPLSHAAFTPILVALLLGACSSPPAPTGIDTSPPLDAALDAMQLTDSLDVPGEMPLTDVAAVTHLFVYPPVPGLDPSDQYAIRVRPIGGDTWHPVFAFITRSSPTGTQAYWTILENWSNTYVNFETDGPVEIEVSRVNGNPIVSAAAHPRARATSVTLANGNAYVVLPGPTQIALDLDGQMDDHDTGMLPGGGTYAGPPIHTLTLFANPMLTPRPSPTDPGVLAVMPGTMPPSTGPWQTLYFLPGVHDIGLAFPIHSHKTYYIPGDAIVYGTFFNPTFTDGNDIHFAGYGTLSGARLTHPAYVTPAVPMANYVQYRPIHDFGANNSSFVGITIADPAYHAIFTPAAADPTRPTDYQWLKILGWRMNGDGINPLANGRIEDSFIRTQDDGSYVSGRGQSRVVYWNDANGSCLVFSDMPNTPVLIDDIDVIYSRAFFNHWSGGRIFNMRGMGMGAAGAGVVFSNIRLEDTRPTLQAFFVAMVDDPPYGMGNARGPGALAGLTFTNLALAASSAVGERDILWGSQIAPIANFTFTDFTIAGAPILDASHFVTNANVSGLTFH